MRKFKTNFGIICGILMLCMNMVWTSPRAENAINKTTVIPIQLHYKPTQVLKKYMYLDCGIKVIVNDASTNDQPHPKGKVAKQTYSFTPSKETFVRESLKRNMRVMGFNVDNNSETDYKLSVIIESFNLFDSRVPNTGIIFNINLYDSNDNILFSTAVYEKLTYATSDSFNKHCAKAIESIDWDGIAAFMHKTTPVSQSKTTKVQGTGKTTLENTIINWEVTSRPAGADLYWRIISSTPDVKNTNKNYKATTPYESTESFDIRGLTYQNSGDVQIELTCEKPGYLPQKKVFNVRMCLDQKSINAHFTLVKDE